MSGRPSARRRRRARRMTLGVAAGAVLVAAAASALLVPVRSGPPQLVTVSPGQSVFEVASMLGDAGIIRSPVVLTAAAYFTGKWRRIQAGRHELEPGMSALEMLDALCRGSRRSWRWLTIPEGYTARQIAAEVEKQGMASASDFLRLASRPREFEVGFPLPQGSLEGYLFPDTYRIEASETAHDIIVQMLRRFEQVVWQGLLDGQSTHHGRSLAQIITLASLVEGEARLHEERAIIAGVLVNRLQRGQRLECDATVQYALGDRRKQRLNHDDLLVDSDYNTYLHNGLPPGPICNPGEAGIRAALQPARVPFLYYVAKPDRSHVFTSTYAEHQAAIARLRKER